MDKEVIIVYHYAWLDLSAGVELHCIMQVPPPFLF